MDFTPNLFKKQYIGHARHEGPYAENSLSLYQYLVDTLHYDIIEADIVFTKDGVPVLNHGRKTNFNTNTQEIVVDIPEITFSNLKELCQINNNQEDNTSITTAEEYIKFGKEKNVIIMLDLTFQHYTFKNYKQLYDIVSKHKMLNRTIWGDADIIKIACLNRHLIVQSGGSWGRRLLLKTLLKSFFCKTIIMSFSYYGGNIEDFANIVKWGHRLGFLMKVATVNDRQTADRFWKIGTDLINTDTLLNTQ